MRALVVYESLFGNTARIAEAIARELREIAEVELAEVGSGARDLGEVDLLIVGGPTHAFGMSRPSTRADSEQRGAPAEHSRGPGLREWLDDAEPSHPGLLAAAFDTRISRPRVPGSAAKGAVRRLRRLGCRVLLPAQSFYVLDTAGPLVEGEEQRAAEWANALTRMAEELRAGVG